MFEDVWVGFKCQCLRCLSLSAHGKRSRFVQIVAKEARCDCDVNV